MEPWHTEIIVCYKRGQNVSQYKIEVMIAKVGNTRRLISPLRFYYKSLYDNLEQKEYYRDKKIAPADHIIEWTWGNNAWFIDLADNGTDPIIQETKSRLRPHEKMDLSVPGYYRYIHRQFAGYNDDKPVYPGIPIEQQKCPGYTDKQEVNIQGKLAVIDLDPPKVRSTFDYTDVIQQAQANMRERMGHPSSSDIKPFPSGPLGKKNPTPDWMQSSIKDWKPSAVELKWSQESKEPRRLTSEDAGREVSPIRSPIRNEASTYRAPFPFVNKQEEDEEASKMHFSPPSPFFRPLDTPGGGKKTRSKRRTVRKRKGKTRRFK